MDATTQARLRTLINTASAADDVGALRAALEELPSDDRTMRPAALINLSQSLQHLGDFDHAQEALEQANALLAGLPDSAPTRVACLLSLTAVAIGRGQWHRALDIAAESLAVARSDAPELAGHPLMNVAAAYFETGHHDLAIDLAAQALTAFDGVGDRSGVAGTQQNLAIMMVRADRPRDAEPLLASSQRFFVQTGNAHRCGIGWKITGFLAEGRHDTPRAEELYRRSLASFDTSGARLEAADVRVRLATLACAHGRVVVGEELLTSAYAEYSSRGLGLHCARIDYWHAHLLLEAADPSRLRHGRDLAIGSALAIDAVRHTFATGSQRHHWNQALADPAMRLAFRFAALTGDAELVTDLIETVCAGTSFSDISATAVIPEAPAPPRLPLHLPEPPSVALGAALARHAADSALPVEPPPRVRLPDGRMALAAHLRHAQDRYGLPIRDGRVLTLPDQPASDQPTVTVRMADAGDLYVAWRWVGDQASPGVGIVPEDQVRDAVQRVARAVPALSAPTTGAFVDPAAENALAQLLSRTFLPYGLAVQLHDLHIRDVRPRILIQPSPRVGQIPWELLAPDPDLRLIELADIAIAPPAILSGLGNRHAWSSRRGLPVVAVLDPRIPGHPADSALGSVLGRPDPSTPVARRVAELHQAGRLRPATTEAFRRTDLDRDWLAQTLQHGASRLLYVGHVTAAAPESGHSEHAQLHLTCGADTPGRAAPVRTHRPLNAADLLLDPARWPMPPRVALIACESGGDLRFTESLGLVAATLRAGATLITATRWPLPTTPTPLQDAICAVDEAHDDDDPVATLGRWQRERLAAWRAAPTLTNSPMVWAAFATVTA